MFNAVDSIVARARPARVGLMALLVVGGCAPVEVPVAEARNITQMELDPLPRMTVFDAA